MTNCLYFTHEEIFNKFNISLYNIDKVSFKLESDSEFWVSIEKDLKSVYRFKIKKYQDRVYREIFGEYTDDMKLKMTANKFLDILETRFDKIQEILKLVNFNIDFEVDIIDYRVGSKLRLQVSRHLYVDINTECPENCLLFLDSHYGSDYGYYTLVNVFTGKIINNSILDNSVLESFNKNKTKFQELSVRQNNLKLAMQLWN